jgi:hypothetical protein
MTRGYSTAHHPRGTGKSSRRQVEALKIIGLAKDVRRPASINEKAARVSVDSAKKRYTNDRGPRTTRNSLALRTRPKQSRAEGKKRFPSFPRSYQCHKENRVSLREKCYSAIHYKDRENQLSPRRARRFRAQAGSLPRRGGILQKVPVYHPGDNYALFGLATATRP